MDKETIKKISDVARLNLTEIEIADFQKGFDGIFEHFSILQNVKSDDSEKNENTQNALRDDKKNMDNDVAKRIMANATKKENNLLKVPKGSK